MNHRVPNYKLDDVYSVPPSSTLTRKSSMAADEVMELLWLNGSRGGSANHAAPVPPLAAPEIQSAVEEAAAEAAQDHLFMQEDEMASWLHYPIQDTNFEPDISDYFNPPPPTPATAPLPELNISTSIELKIKPQDETVSLSTGAAARPPVSPPSLPVQPRRRNNFVHLTKLPAAAAMKESRSPLSLDKAAKESTVVESNDTPKLSQVGSNELPKVECGKNEGGGTSTLAGGSTATIHSDDLTSASGESGGSMTDCVETPQPTLVIGMNREEETEGMKSEDRKRKGRGGGADDESQSLNNEFESGKGKKREQASTSTKRSRAAEVHNLSERKRRDRINEKMKNLQEIVPCCNKTDKASMLDDVIEYMKTLQSQIQMMSMGYGMVPITYPGVQPYMPPMGMSMSQPLVPYPPMLPVSTMPIPATGVPMHMPVVHDQSGVQASNPVNPAMISVARHNPHPNFTNPYLQYLGPQHCQVLIPPQNQAATEQNNAKPSTSKEDVKC